MDDSIAQGRVHAGSLDLPAWKTILSVSSAVLLGLLFIVAGVWKITEPYAMAERMIQLKVPGALSLPVTLAVGIVETFAGVLLFVPRFRRWGAWITGLMLIVFMIYVGFHYTALAGEECSCFPWIKRAVGPGFFIGDGVMLLMAIAAGVWAPRPESRRVAGVILGAVCVFAMVSFGVAYARQSGAEAPASITADGQPLSLSHGKYFLYFFDPECSHCYQAAKEMAAYKWRGVSVIAVPTVNPQFAQSFLKDTGLKAKVSNDLELLRKAFPFVSGPFGVAVQNGRQKQSFNQFEGDQPSSSLRALEFVE